MSKLHPNAMDGQFLPETRAGLVLDASLELAGLVKKTLADHFPDEAMRDESNFVLRGCIQRIESLAQVMYSAACESDESLREDLRVAYGRHHKFTATEGEAT